MILVSALKLVPFGETKVYVAVVWLVVFTEEKYFIDNK